MWWFIIIAGILLFSLWIEYRRKKRRNDKNAKSIDPSINKGKVGSDWNSGDGPAGF
ncbi:hypothetical protein [Cytobacillus massiliigabonensis]|uniref:hypothetical protein n=1 Tax=Cytobacillus massiliigabonensis TaxID=1871011 RepID=UPI0015E0CB2B|nr:hypothetical protein [Cytobacillus massiliigabonensis]